MKYPSDVVLYEKDGYKIIKYEKRRFSVIQPNSFIVGPYSTFGAATLAITLSIDSSKNIVGKRMGEK